MRKLPGIIIILMFLLIGCGGKKTVADCHLEGVENINYLQAIKRVIGMSDKPLANE